MDTSEPKSMVRVHALLLDALRSVDRYLRRHDMEYWLTGGALLGAFRSGDLLPWDDDIDLGMRRETFERLSQIARIDPPEGGLVWHAPAAGNRRPRFLPGCLGIAGTAAVEFTPTGCRIRQPGLAIDLWPFDEQPRSACGQRLNRLLAREHYVAESFRLGLLATPERLRGRLHKVFLEHITQRQWQYAMASLRRWGRASGLWSYGAESGWELAFTKLDMFRPVGSVRLGDRSYPSPHRPSAYLESKYGVDFRRPPPPERRKPHNRFIALATDLAVPGPPM